MISKYPFHHLRNQYQEINSPHNQYLLIADGDPAKDYAPKIILATISELLC